MERDWTQLHLRHWYIVNVPEIFQIRHKVKLMKRPLILAELWNDENRSVFYSFDLFQSKISPFVVFFSLVLYYSRLFPRMTLLKLQGFFLVRSYPTTSSTPSRITAQISPVTAINSINSWMPTINGSINNSRKLPEMIFTGKRLVPKRNIEWLYNYISF